MADRDEDWAQDQERGQEPGHIEPEDHGSDADSALDMPIESLASIKTSILQYHEENGRTYHSPYAREYLYVLPNDEGEQERMDILHHLYILTYDGRYCLSPKNGGAKRVLDMGTGTGMWAMDFADAHPDSEVIGVDLSPIQPDFVPPNCSFEIDDLEKDWTWSKPFDFVFCRGLSSAFGSWEATMKKAYDALEPGGYFEVHDGSFPLGCDDDSLSKDTALYQWCDYIVEGAQKLGRPTDMVFKYKDLMAQAGFVDITELRFKWPTNRWPRDPKYKELGQWSLTALDGGIEGICLALFTRALGWSKEETITFCAQVRKDIRNPKIHAYWQIVVVYGRKPEDAPYSPPLASTVPAPAPAPTPMPASSPAPVSAPIAISSPGPVLPPDPASSS